MIAAPSHTFAVLAAACALALGASSAAAQQDSAAGPRTSLLLVPDAVWDGVAGEARPGWVVLVADSLVAAVGPAGSVEVPPDAERVDLRGTTLMPGLIEGHGHLFLHPYDETLWDDQVLKEPSGLRMARAVAHADATLRAGVTTLRDLGTEGVGDYDVQLKRAIGEGIVPGPRLIVATRAIVARGAYAPRRPSYAFEPIVGAEEASGADEIRRVVRDQIGRGADWIKVYADFPYGPTGATRPAFSQEELNVLVETATDAGVPVAAHAMSPEGMRRAVLAGVKTIEHGDGGTPEVFRLMAERGVALCPTLAAGEAYAKYFEGWDKATGPAPASVARKRESFRAALAAGVPICFGGDVGVYSHGTNTVELELMVEYGMRPAAALRAATSGNARLFGLEQLGTVAPGMLADLIAVEGDPLADIAVVRRIRCVHQAGSPGASCATVSPRER